MHEPHWHDPGWQVLPQVPQFPVSVVTSTHVPLQHAGTGAEHAIPTCTIVPHTWFTHVAAMHGSGAGQSAGVLHGGPDAPASGMQTPELEPELELELLDEVPPAPPLAEPPPEPPEPPLDATLLAADVLRADDELASPEPPLVEDSVVAPLLDEPTLPLLEPSVTAPPHDAAALAQKKSARRPTVLMWTMALSGRRHDVPSTSPAEASSFLSRRLRIGPRTMHLGAALATLAAMTWVACPARADQSTDIDLRWRAPTECPDESYVRTAVERLAARPLAAPGGRWVPVRIEAAPAERGWTVHIAIGNLADGAPPHERRIEGRTCGDVADAAAVAVAIAIVPASSPAPPAPPAVAQPLLEDAPPPASGADRIEPPPPSQAVRLRPALRVAAGADFASLPAPSFGGEVAVALRFGADRVDVHASAWLPEQAPVASDAMASARIWLVTGGARYCRALLQRAIELDGCAGLEAGALLGQSYGVTRPASGAAPWVAPELGAAALWHLGRRFSMTLALEGLVPAERKTFEIAGLGALFRPPPVTGRTLLGLDFHLE